MPDKKMIKQTFREKARPYNAFTYNIMAPSFIILNMVANAVNFSSGRVIGLVILVAMIASLYYNVKIKLGAMGVIGPILFLTGQVMAVPLAVAIELGQVDVADTLAIVVVLVTLVGIGFSFYAAYLVSRRFPDFSADYQAARATYHAARKTEKFS